MSVRFLPRPFVPRPFVPRPFVPRPFVPRALPARSLLARAAGRAAFTLVELMVALTIAAIIATAAMSMFLTVRATAIETAVRAQVARDGQAVLDLVAHDLRFFGAGVPLGVNGDAPASPASGKSLLPIIRVARDDNLVFLGDLPYPNAELPGLAAVAYIGDSGSAAHRLAVTSETSGFCIPPDSGAAGRLACRTSRTTLLPGLQSAADCIGDTGEIDDSTGAAGFLAARTCPWGMNKWLLGAGEFVHLTVVGADGRWFERRNRSGEIGGSDIDGLYSGLHLDHDFPSADDEDLGRARFFAGSGGSYVAVMDRVFFAVEDTANPGTRCTGAVGGDCSLRRRQCWGRLEDPAAAAFPASGTVSFVGSSTPQANCTATSPPEDGTRWETVVSGVEDITFSYYGNATTPLAGSGPGQPLSAAQAGQVRAIEVEVRVSRRIPGTAPSRFLSDIFRRRFFLPNQQ
jgi:prepilin-type N-terminal cleavage/methylation domain-containing protein